LFLVVVLGVLVWIACSDSGNPVAPPVGPSTVPDSVSFKNHVQPIFTARCAVSGCHVAPNPPAGLVLKAGSAYANIVNVPAQNFSGLRVAPNDPSQSVLYLLVESGQMPARGSRLTTVQVQTIKRWIEQGALDN
jgi:hypothetical protein